MDSLEWTGGEAMRRQSMRIAATITFILALATAAAAADPIIGSWKLNVAKSYFADKQWIPKQKTVIYRELNPGQIELTVKGTEADKS
jgi:hypothetical protein